MSLLIFARLSRIRYVKDFASEKVFEPHNTEACQDFSKTCFFYICLMAI